MTSSKTFYFTTALRAIFTEKKVNDTGDVPAFDDIANYDDFWNVMKGPILNGLFKETWYNEQPIDDKQRGYVLFENRILGSPRLRQLRVRFRVYLSNWLIAVFSSFRSNLIHVRFTRNLPVWSVIVTHRIVHAKKINQLILLLMSTIVLHQRKTNKIRPINSNWYSFRWYYKSSSELDGSSTSGLISRYGGGGYILDLKMNYSASSNQFEGLRLNRWIDRGTRVVFLDFTVYNANINLFCQIKLIVEFPAAGGAVPSKTFQSVKLIRVRWWDEKTNKQTILLFSMFHQWIILS